MQAGPEAGRVASVDQRVDQPAEPGPVFARGQQHKHLSQGSGVDEVLQDVLHAVDTLAQLKIVHRCVVVAWVACFFCALHLAESLCALQ